MWCGSRKCTNLEPKVSGKDCPGSDMQVKVCKADVCPGSLLLNFTWKHPKKYTKYYKLIKKTHCVTYSQVHCSSVLKALSFQSFYWICATKFAEFIQFWQNPKCRRPRTFWRKTLYIYIVMWWLPLKQTSIKTNVATDEGNSRNETWHWTKDEIGVAVRSWLWVWAELMAW